MTSIGHTLGGKSLKIWCNLPLPETVAEPFTRLLKNNEPGHELVLSDAPIKSVWAAASGDTSSLAGFDIAFGQPTPAQVLAAGSIQWVQLSSAGYAAWDKPEIRQAVADRGIIVTSSSHVFDDPCAQHVLAFMLSQSRQITAAALAHQQRGHWDSPAFRSKCKLLGGQTVLIFGFGAIAHRLIDLLAPMQLDIIGVKRNPTAYKGVRIVNLQEGTSLLKYADYVINILPDNADSARFFNREILGQIKHGGCFINIGRGTTVDQSALVELLSSGHLGAACLDVADPEPLPDEHPLWKAPNCLITPHIAGGFSNEQERLISHFVENMDRLLAGEKLMDRVLG